MNAEDRRYDFDRVFRLGLTVGGFLAIFYLVWYLSDVLLPFAVALVLAYLLNPIATRIEAKVRRRWLAVLATVLGFVVVCVGVAALVVPRVLWEMEDFSVNIQKTYARDPTLGGLLSGLPEDFREQIDAAIEEIVREVDDAFLIDAAKKVLPRLWGIIAGGLSLVLSLMTVVVIFLYLAFLLLDFRSLEANWKEYLPPAYRESVVGFSDEFREAMSKYFRGQFVVAMCVGVLFAIGFSIVGIRLPILLGLGIGLLNMVPYLQVVGVVPAFCLGALRGVETGGSVIWMLVAVAAVFAVVQTIQDGFLTPKIIGDRTGLRPVWILLSLTIWGKLLGFLGLVLAIPLTCLAFAYYRRYLESIQKEAIVQ